MDDVEFQPPPDAPREQLQVARALEDLLGRSEDHGEEPLYTPTAPSWERDDPEEFRRDLLQTQQGEAELFYKT